MFRKKISGNISYPFTSNDHFLCALRMCAMCALLVCYTLIFTLFQHSSKHLKAL